MNSIDYYVVDLHEIRFVYISKLMRNKLSFCIEKKISCFYEKKLLEFGKHNSSLLRRFYLAEWDT